MRGERAVHPDRGEGGRLHPAVPERDVEDGALHRLVHEVHVEDVVAQRVRHDDAAVRLDALDPVRVATHDEVRAGVDQRPGDDALVRLRLVRVLRAPVRHHDHQVDLLVQGPDSSLHRGDVGGHERPRTRAHPHLERARDTRRGARRLPDRVERQHPDGRAVALEHRRRLGLGEVRATADRHDPGLADQPERLDDRLAAVVAQVVRGHGQHVEPGQRQPLTYDRVGSEGVPALGRRPDPGQRALEGPDREVGASQPLRGRAQRPSRIAGLRDHSTDPAGEHEIANERHRDDAVGRDSGGLERVGPRVPERVEAGDAEGSKGRPHDRRRQHGDHAEVCLGSQDRLGVRPDHDRRVRLLHVRRGDHAQRRRPRAEVGPVGDDAPEQVASDVDRDVQRRSRGVHGEHQRGYRLGRFGGLRRRVAGGSARR